MSRYDDLNKKLGLAIVYEIEHCVVALTPEVHVLVSMRTKLLVAAMVG